jgi:thioesterase domain-containing protein/acyl carrier protein
MMRSGAPPWAIDADADPAGLGVNVGALRMCRIWEGVLGFGPIGPDDDFFELGGDSLQALDVLAAVERAFGRRLPPTALFAAPTCAGLAAMARAAEGPDPDPLVPLRERGEGPPLFLIPGAGGSVFVFENLLKAVDLGRPVYGFGLPPGGPEGDSPATLEELADRYVTRALAAQPEGPYYLGGYSFGGRVAFEMARRLAAAGRPVAFLGLFDTYGPAYPRPLPPLRRLLGHLRAYRVLDADGRRGYLRERLRRVVGRVNGLAGAVARPPWLRAAVVPVFIRDDFEYHRRLTLAYAPGVYPGRLTLFRAAETPGWFGVDFSDPWLGWDGLAAGGVEVRPVPGGHLTLFEEPHVRDLALSLKACLAG